MKDLSDEEYIEPKGSCHKDIFEEAEQDCSKFTGCCEECPYWY